jgi:hypothetical protein
MSTAMSGNGARIFGTITRKARQRTDRPGSKGATQVAVSSAAAPGTTGHRISARPPAPPTTGSSTSASGLVGRLHLESLALYFWGPGGEAPGRICFGVVSMMDKSKRTGAAIDGQRIESQAVEPPVSPESLFGKIVRILKQPRHRAILSWLAGAAAVTAAATGTAAAYIFPHKDVQVKAGATSLTGTVKEQSGQSPEPQAEAAQSILALAEPSPNTATPRSEFSDYATFCPTMIVVPAGKFTMGSPENEPGR